ncbi:MAG: GTPase ObgE [bacterium]|nr:GTPase ObgE [bacterium]
MLIDDVEINLRAGSGGRGGAYFQRIKFSLGPTGADGGMGGSIWFEGVSDIGAFSQFRHKKDIHAEDGKNGKAQFNDGRRGEDVVLKIPVGTVIHYLNTGDSVELTKIGERIQAARGGKGGRGNFKFRSSTNTSPREFEHGRPGDELSVRLELKLIADVGLVGLPNAGKSSLLNELTKAKSKVANYPFTTLEPNLGVYYDLVIADIPGLIEGASSGKGLGTKFLRHIERTDVLFHLISAESSDPVTDYRVIRRELEAHGALLADKKEYVFLSKTDMVSREQCVAYTAALLAIGVHPQLLSVLDEDLIQNIEKVLATIQKGKYLSVENTESL